MIYCLYPGTAGNLLQLFTFCARVFLFLGFPKLGLGLMKGFVYILEDDGHMYYIGCSIEPTERYKRHMSGFVYTTHRMKNPKLVFTQEFETIQIAKKIERRLKRLKRKDYIKKIVEDGYIKMKV